MTLILRILVLWVPFSLGALAAIIISFFSLVTDDADYAKRVLLAMDKLLAVLLGWSGERSVSAECGGGSSGCRFCRFVCAILNRLETDHCRRAALRETLK